MPADKDFLPIFKAEVDDCLAKLNQGLIDLEKSPDNIGLIKELNREAHNIKGSARIFGYREIQEIGHNIEGVFDKISQKRIVFNPFVANRIFKGLDTIKILLEKIVSEEKIDVDISSVCRELEKCIGGGGESAEEETVPEKEEAPGMKEKEPAPEKEKERIKKPEVIKDKGKEDPASASRAKSKEQLEEYIRVPASRVSKLLNLVGELVINKLAASRKIQRAKTISLLTKGLQKSVAEVDNILNDNPSLKNNQILALLNRIDSDMNRLRETSLKLYEGLSAEALHLDPVIDELQRRTKEIRMLPCATVFQAFPRLVRDIAQDEGKEVNLEIYGEGTELDKKVLEGIKDPLMHILRNCVGHGIEHPQKRLDLGKPKYGTIKVNAFHEAGNVIITVEDDGGGIALENIRQTAVNKRIVSAEDLAGMTEKEILNLVFTNGYSTSSIITDLSGRGIGLDVVRKNIEDLKGRVLLDTEVNKGTKFTFSLPLTIAIVQVLLIKTKGTLFAIPKADISEVIDVNVKDISTLEGRMAVEIRGHSVPLIKLDEIIDVPSSGQTKTPANAQELPTIIASFMDKNVGFIVEEVVGEDEIFIKSLGQHLGNVKNVSGATVLGTGEVIVILDASDLISQSHLTHPALSGKPVAQEGELAEKCILVVEDSLSTREMEKNLLTSQGYNVDTAINGLEGLNMLANTRYDLIVTDIEMPEMDGFEFCKTVKGNDKYKDIPVVIVTALEKESDKRRGIEVGAQAYIVKTTFDQSNLLDTVARLI